MTIERRASEGDVLAVLKEFKLEIKEDMKEIKDELKIIDDKIHATVQDNNKFYFNGFDPHKHVQDHHKIDDMMEKSKENSRSVRSTVEKWVDRAAWACITFIAMSTWSTVTDNINKAKIQEPTKIEQKVDQKDSRYGPPSSNP